MKDRFWVRCRVGSLQKQPICNREHVFNLKFYSICTEFYRDFRCDFHSCFITIIICNLNHSVVVSLSQCLHFPYFPQFPTISLPIHSGFLVVSYFLILERIQCILDANLSPLSVLHLWPLASDRLASLSNGRLQCVHSSVSISTIILFFCWFWKSPFLFSLFFFFVNLYLNK